MRPAPVLVLIAVLAVPACGSSPQSKTPTPAPVPAASTSASAPSTERITTKVDAPVGLAVAANGLWAVSTSTNAIVRVDPSTGAILETVTVGPTPLRAAAYGHLVWVSIFGAGEVVAVDARSGRVVQRVPVGAGAEGVSIDAHGLVWVVSQDAHRLTGLDQSGKIRTRVVLPHGQPRAVLADDAGVFVSDYMNGTVSRVEHGRLTTRHICDGAQEMRGAGSRIFVACTAGNQVIELDTRLHVLGHVSVPGEPDGLALLDDRLWIACATGPALVALTISPLRIDRTVHLADGPALDDRANVDVAYAGGRLWLSSYRDDGLYAVAP
ncbi:MAG TPA: hypothetical protein VGF84_15320 [Micromonosporaceae bacterium]